ncbi:GNAT family N-acetyltransferase [Photobacterium sp. J15]|uniref:GNAT family N-acetyltransferase n=1 Tax=Photobacterium sp. J15 TaxID=265901 RepID=UPI0007E3232C|nr:GNAT family protein [Photobacterium sp. J15]
MFRLKVDDEINLVLVNEKLAPSIAEQVAGNLEHLSQWLAWPRFCTTVDDFKAFIQKSLHDYADGKSMVCAIEYQGSIVGVSGFNTILPNLKKTDIGYWLAAEHQHKGIITRVCRSLIQYAFEELELEVVTITPATENAASRAVCERLNMTFEGIIPHAENIGGVLLNHAIYACYK